jgi:hypothetical protein
MAEVLVEFDTTVTGSDGARWMPRACGRVTDGGLWEGWIEFSAGTSAAPVRTPRETEQPNRDALMYWAQGLTQVYLESALVRALEPPRRRPSPQSATRPYFETPAPRFAPDHGPSVPRPVLNPFEVYQQGENVLFRQLSALSRARLLDIVVGYGMPSAAAAHDSSRETLVSTIMSAVRRPAENRGSDSART